VKINDEIIIIKFPSIINSVLLTENSMDVIMEDLTSVPVQQPQPGHLLSGLAPGLPLVPGQTPIVPGETPVTEGAASPPSDPTPMVVDENPCETLYIQNLNEKVKPQGLFVAVFFLFS